MNRQPSLRQINAALDGENIEAMRPVAGLSPQIAAIVALDDHRQQLAGWADRTLEERRAPIEEEADKWRRQQAASTANAERLMNAMGIQGSAPESWDQVLDAVERERREVALLGPDRHTETMRQQGRVVVEHRRLPVADTAKKIREHLDEAQYFKREAQRADVRADAMTLEAIDEQHLGWMDSWGPRVPTPGTDSRPELDADTVRLLNDSEITFD